MPCVKRDASYRVKGFAFLLCILFLSIYSNIEAQNYNLTFDHLNKENGLNGLYNNYFYEDSRGFTWISSIESLHRYNGNTIEIFEPNPADSNSIPDRFINSNFFEDSKGNIWFATRNNLVKYDYYTANFKSYRKYFEQKELTTECYVFYIDDEDKVWLTFQLGGQKEFYTFNPQNNSYSRISTLRGNRHLIREMPNDTFQIISYSKPEVSHLFRNTIAHGKHISTDTLTTPGKDSISVTNSAILAQSDSILLVCSRAQLYKLNLNTLEIIQANVSSKSWLNNISDITHFDSSIYLLTTYEGDLFFYNLNKNIIFDSIPFNPEIPGNYKYPDIRSAYRSQNGILWLSSWFYGIGHTNLNDFKFSSRKLSELVGIENLNIRSIIETEEFILFGSESNGLLTFNKKGQYTSHKKTENIGIKDLMLENLFYDNQGKIWASGYKKNSETDNSNIFLVDQKSLQFEEILTIDGNIYSFFHATNGDIYTLTSEGVSKLSYDDSDNNFYAEEIFPEVNGKAVTQMIETADHGFLLSLDAESIYSFKNEDGNYRLEHVFKNIPFCNSIARISDSKFLLSTSTGLQVLDLEVKNNNQILTNKELFESVWFEDVFALDESYWAISKYDFLNLNSNFEIEGIYNLKNGIKGEEDIYKTFSFLTRDKHLMVVQNDNLFYFNPDEIITSESFSDIYIQKISINERPYKTNRNYIFIDSIELKYNENTLSFNFGSLGYIPVENINYQYRLLGHEREWVSAESIGQCRYSNISPGDYILELRSSGSYGNWNPIPKRIGIKISPPWYATGWMFGIYFLVLLAIIFAIYHYIQQRHRKKLTVQEEKIKQEQHINSELRRVDELKDQFLANTSHELRTPLNGIIGIAETLMDGATGELPETTKEQLNLIYASGKRLSSLVNDILDFSKLKNSDIELQLGKVDLRSTGNVVFQLMKPLAESKSLDLINDIPIDTLLVNADENRVQQILFNLIGNAIKFTEKGFVRLSASKVKEYIEIFVEDSGIGIPPEKIEDIFNWFEQGDGNVARTYGGTGLGLSVSKHLIELHKGVIRVKTEVNSGSIFSFTLPISEDQDKSDISSTTFLEESIIQKGLKETDESVVHDHNHSGIHILTVDDEIVNQRVLLNHLSLSGYKVSQASDGESALKVIEGDKSIDAIILDIMMPRMSGYEVCREIRKKHSAAELPIILLTAKNRISDLVKGFEAGANDYLTKPFSRGELLSRITSHLGIREFSRATAKFVPHAFLHKIGRNEILDVKRGDHALCEVSVLFADIRNFTRISESMSPEENFEFVNRYAGIVGPIIQKRDGFINQYLGDGIMAVFPKETDQTLKAAIELQKAVEKFNISQGEEGNPQIEIGIGFHTGDLVLGIIGDDSRSDPATISDTVNIASRLEGLTKYFGARIIISGASQNNLPKNHNFNLRFLGKVMVKGKAKAIDVFECFDGDPEPLRALKLEWSEMFREALSAYFKKDFFNAYGILRDMVTANPEDRVATHFRNLSAKNLHAGVDEKWDGIARMTEK